MRSPIKHRIRGNRQWQKASQPKQKKVLLADSSQRSLRFITATPIAQQKTTIRRATCQAAILQRFSALLAAFGLCSVDIVVFMMSGGENDILVINQVISLLFIVCTT
ncbi:hypothetical protein [Cerasicoccus arenae]|uniref:hypothetical protein n=1 Tax=Cerasicoccus arenae TaxID=424488 RepID=UPI001675778D|nr:hypothetical protein [Cerasicoccus arenae]MBK1856927.1 hypothetical protein [Cerasicoccus arenae]